MILPLPFAWPEAVPFWAVMIVVFAPEVRLEHRARAVASAQRAQDRGSLWLIIVAGRLAWTLGVLAAAFLPAATIEPGRHTAFLAGLGLLGAGGLLRFHCRRTLGRYFTGTVTVVPDQPVITNGAYRWVRHPSYTAAMMVVTGIGLALTNWLSVLLLTGLPAVSYGIRVRAEERALLATIGDPYRDYMRHTKRFIPFLF